MRRQGGGEKVKHFGNVCEIKGNAVPLVDIVTGGSPC